MKQHYVLLIALCVIGYIPTSYAMDYGLDTVLLTLHVKFPSNTWIANARDRTKPEIKKEVEDFIDTYANQVNYNCYAALDLDPSASEAAIKKAYHTLSIVCHPDKTQCPAAPKLFRTIHTAYQALENQNKRQLYNFLIKSVAASINVPNSQYSEAQRQRTRNAIATIKRYNTQMGIITAFKSPDINQLKIALDELRREGLELPTALFQTISTEFHTIPLIGEKLRSIIAYDTHKTMLQSRYSHRNNLLHLFAQTGFADGITVICDSISHDDRSAMLVARNADYLTPCESAIQAFIRALNADWRITRDNKNHTLTKIEVQSYCTTIKLLASRTHAICRTNEGLLTQFKNSIFHEARWPYIGFLIDQTDAAPTAPDRTRYPILTIVTPEDCKVSYDRLAAFSIPDLSGSIHTAAQILWAAHRHGWDYLLFDGITFTSLADTCRAHASNTIQRLAPPVPTVHQKVRALALRYWSKFRYALLAGTSSFVGWYLIDRSIRQTIDNGSMEAANDSEIADHMHPQTPPIE